jgi:hypothetical protein
MLKVDLGKETENSYTKKRKYILQFQNNEKKNILQIKNYEERVYCSTAYKAEFSSNFPPFGCSARSPAFLL